MFKLKRPCTDCPFVKGSSTNISLSSERIEGIIDSIKDDKIFYCHKTIDYNKQLEDEDDSFSPIEQNQFCAGALVYLEKKNHPNQMMRIAERIGSYDHRKLKGHDIVID